MSEPKGKVIVNAMTTQKSRFLAALAAGYADVDGRSQSDLWGFAGKMGALVRYFDQRDQPEGDWASFFPSTPVRDDGKTPPHLALYSAFTRLFGTAQSTVNAFSTRLVDFYYRDLLRDAPRGPVGDSTYLTFTLTDDAPSTGVKIAKGTLFLAGQDKEGIDIVYAADKALQAMPAQLSALRSVRVVTGPLFVTPAEKALRGEEWTGTDAAKGKDTGEVVRQVLSSEITPNGAPFPTFGPVATGESPVETTSAATLGFALASVYLHLGGGARQVKVKIRYSSEAIYGLLARISIATFLCPVTVLEEVIGAAFKLSVTTEKGWFALDGYKVSIAWGEGGFEATLTIDLTADAPAVVAYDASAGEGASEAAPVAPVPSATLPMLKAELVQTPLELTGDAGTVSVYPLSLLADAVIESLGLSVSASGITDLVVENTDGEVDPSQPFSLLGAAPGPGSYLGLRSRELFEKRVDTLTLSLSWLGLPANDDGFFGYYRDYKINLRGETQTAPLFTNESFTVQATVARHGSFQVAFPAPAGLGAPTDYLFRTCESADPLVPCVPVDPPVANGKLAGTTVFDNLVVTDATAPAYYDPSKSTLRLSLVGPAYGFGDVLYAQNVLYNVLQDLPDRTTNGGGGAVRTSDRARAERTWTENTGTESTRPEGTGTEGTGTEGTKIDGTRTDGTGTDGTRTEDPPPPETTVKYPSAPWIPMVTGVVVSYTASCGVLGADGQRVSGRFYHLLPFGGWAELPEASRPHLLPRFAFEGSLLLGFTGLPSASALTLLFELSEDGRDSGAAELPAVTWEVLSRDRWVKLTTGNLRSDGTRGLQATGILDLALPTFDESAGSRLPGDLTWLRASVRSSAGDFPDMVDVRPNAVTVTWQNDGSSGVYLEKPLARHTIQGPVNAIDGIDKVDQPLESTGGRPPETNAMFHVRMGERLRHKDRGILTWDHERLVLDRFPQVQKVRALPASTPERADGRSPGDVLVVVVVSPDSREQQDPLAPVAPADTLEAIRASLAASASPFVRLHVVNPAYVRIEVAASVVFRDGEDAGECIVRLNDELKAYLSPWSDHDEDAGGADYWTEDRLTDFVQTREYVAALDSISFSYSPDQGGPPWCFLTSAAKHQISMATDASRGARDTESRSLPAPDTTADTYGY